MDGRILRIVLVYAVFSAAWILFSDTLVAQIIADPERIAEIGTIKGWAFVAVTSCCCGGYFARWRAQRLLFSPHPY